MSGNHTPATLAGLVVIAAACTIAYDVIGEGGVLLTAIGLSLGVMWSLRNYRWQPDSGCNAHPKRGGGR